MKARDNPFGSDRLLRVRYRLAGLTWDGLMQRLASMRYRGALVGPEGSGKTTLLEELAPRLQDLGFRVEMLWARDGRGAVAAPIGSRRILLLDNAELLGRTRWFWLRWRARNAGGLVITSHRPGLLPTLLECSTTPALFGEVVSDLVGAAEAANLRNLTVQLFAKHKGNLREALRELYDLYAARAV